MTGNVNSEAFRKLSIQTGSPGATASTSPNKSTSTTSTNPAQNLALGSLNAARGKPAASSAMPAAGTVDPAVLARISMVRLEDLCLIVRLKDIVCRTRQARFDSLNTFDSRGQSHHAGYADRWRARRSRGQESQRTRSQDWWRRPGSKKGSNDEVTDLGESDHSRSTTDCVLEIC